MIGFRDFTDRVTMGQDGRYRWKCPIDKEYERMQYRFTFKVMAVVSAAMVAFGAFLDMEFLLTVVLIETVGLMAVIALVIFIVSRVSGQPVQRYRMTDEYVEIVNAKASVFHRFDRIKEIVVNPRYLELHGRIRVSRIYIPQEDYPFVKGYILNHTMGSAVVRHGSMGQAG